MVAYSLEEMADWYREGYPEWNIESLPGMIVFRRDIYESAPVDINEEMPETTKITLSYALSEEEARMIMTGGYEDILREQLNRMIEK
jgi:hypothetical protein